jgi:hypothetical protein
MSYGVQPGEGHALATKPHTRLTQTCVTSHKHVLNVSDLLTMLCAHDATRL